MQQLNPQLAGARNLFGDAIRNPIVPRIATLLLAFAILLWRMPHRRDDDDRGPGAVV